MSMEVTPFYIPTNREGKVLFPLAFTICIIHNDGHSDWYEVILIVILVCISIIISDVSIFSCARWPSVCLLWRNVYLGLLFIFFLLGWVFDIELFANFVDSYL